MAKTITREEIKSKDLRREYKRFIGEKKLDYYLSKFERMEEKNNRLSFNLSALIFSTFWCFYRKMFLPGALFLALNCAVSFVQMRFLANAPLIVSAMVMIIALIPNLFCGIFGNSLYYNYIHGCIDKSINMNNLQKEKYYKENGGSSARVAAGVVAAYLIFTIALFLSFAPNFTA